MSILELGALGEFFGSVGVIATLIYLAAQVRQNTKTTRVQATTAAAEMAQNVFLTLATNPDLHQLQTRHLQGDHLNDDEQRRVYALRFAQFSAFENHFVQASEGVLSEDIVRARRERIRGMLSTEPMREWWKDTRQSFANPLQETADQIVSEYEGEASKSGEEQ